MSANPETAHTLLRRLNEPDLDHVFEIEIAAYPFPWTRGIFSDCLRVGYDCWGLQLEGALIGYCLQSHGAGESHLLNLCVAPPWQRQGYGDIMLEHVVRQAYKHDCFCIFLEVRPSNPAGIKLYRKNGFIVVGERPDYYRAGEGKENAIVMRLDLDSPESWSQSRNASS